MQPRVLAFLLIAGIAVTLAPTRFNAAARAADAPAAEPAPAPIAPPAMKFDDAVRANDRFLFVGDEVTQQMFFTRGVATALISMKPGYSLRFFNGGKEGATAESAGKWIDEVLDLARPTVVVLSFGFNDGQGKTGDDAKPIIEAYRVALESLVKRAAGYKDVRKVIVLSAPPWQAGLTDPIDPRDYNATLFYLSEAAAAAAKNTGAAFIDLFDPMRRVYLGQIKVGGDPLTTAGKMPTEAAHVVIASYVLRGMGVTAPMLDPTAWSPLMPRDMARLRGVLGVPAKAGTIERAQQSRDLYTCLLIYDQAFFKLWRIAGKRPSADSKQTVSGMAEEAWIGVREASEPFKK